MIGPHCSTAKSIHMPSEQAAFLLLERNGYFFNTLENALGDCAALFKSFMTRELGGSLESLYQFKFSIACAILLVPSHLWGPQH